MQPTDQAWIRRRARRLQSAFKVNRARAVREAAAHWWRFLGLPRAPGRLCRHNPIAPHLADPGLLATLPTGSAPSAPRVGRDTPPSAR